MKRCLSLTLALIASHAAATASPATGGSPFRYDDDPTPFAEQDDLYGRFKYHPLGRDAYVSLGADLRERVEGRDTTFLGLQSHASQVYDLHRLLMFADLQASRDARVFVQVGNHDEVGRAPGPSPLDVDRLDLSQAFIDISRRVGGGRATLRLGRAEMSLDDGALIGLRDGPNVRQSWDGARLTYTGGPWHLDLFAVRPVAVEPGVFDDRGAAGQSLEGVHVTFAPRAMIAVDSFTTAISIRGSRYSARRPARRLKPSASASAARAVRRKARSEQSVRPVMPRAAPSAPLPFTPTPGGASGTRTPPHVELRADLLSGGAPTDRTTGTFNALYPNVAYSTEATIEAPANLVQLGLVTRINPAPAFNMQYTVEGLWRYTSRDAFYAAPLHPLVLPDGSGDRFTGVEQQVRGTYQINRFVTLIAAVVHLAVGDFIRRAGGGNEVFGMTSISARL